MKKFIMMFSLVVFALPAMAVCPINGGACSISSNWNSTSLKEKYVPDRLNQMQKTDAFQPKYVTPYRSELINTESSNVTTTPQNDYNSNCQFGVCLPGVEPGVDVLE